MITVKPIQSKSDQEFFCSKCNIHYDEDLMAYGAYVDGEFVGICQFAIKGDRGFIKNIAPVSGTNDFEAMFIMGRGTMNFIDLCENHTCYADDNSASERLLLAIGFKRKDDKYFCDMTGMFDGHCDGHKVELE